MKRQAGRWRASFLDRIGIKSAIVDQVVPLVENHLAHSSIGMDVTPRAVRRLAVRLAPASIAQLMRLIEADASGRPPREQRIARSGGADSRYGCVAGSGPRSRRSPLIHGPACAAVF